MEERVRKGQAEADKHQDAGFLSDYVDKDDIMRRLAENINDEKYLKTTLATYNAETNSAEISYGPVDTSLIPPRDRSYGKKSEVTAETAAEKKQTAALV